MSALLISILVFCVVYVAARAGTALQTRLPETHLDPSSKESVQLVMGLIATMAALVLSLLIASSHASFETQQEEVQKLARDVLLLDVALDNYGADAADLRKVLRDEVIAATRAMSPDEGFGSVKISEEGPTVRKDRLFDRVQALQPKTDPRRFDQTKALELLGRIGAARLLIHEQATDVVPAPLVIVMVLWLMLLFLGFGLFAPDNATVHFALGLGAFAVAGALFLILDMSHPYRGLIHVSGAPIQSVIDQIGR